MTASRTLTLSLDVMGGDFGPKVVLPGANLALEWHPGLRYLLYGRKEEVLPLLSDFPLLQSAATFYPAEQVVEMKDKPAHALLRGRRSSSMWQAIDSVKTGAAQAVVSAGNTGALMAMSKVLLKTLHGIERPALAAVWPTLRGESIVLDVGATVGADASQLVDFAIMGASLAQCLFHLQKPVVGLLNIGAEEVKGNEEVKEAAKILRMLELPLVYRGFLEGDDLGKGMFDVIVTEGFSGNIALKTAEGTALQLMSYLKTALRQTWLSRLGALLARGAFMALKEKIDPKTRNGAVFLGLCGLVVKSHGGTDALGFAHAIDVAVKMVENNIVERIESGLVLKGGQKEC